MKRNLGSTLALALFTLAAASMASAAGPYHFLKEIPVGGAGGWDYLTVDSAAQRLYVSHATKVVVIDLLAFASCGGGDGSVTIAHEDAPDKLTVVQTLRTEKRAKTMILDPAPHKIYLGAAKFEPAKAGEKRPGVVPGSFRVLVYGMDKS